MAYLAAGKRRGVDPAVTRERVLAAAEELILSGEFATATVAELAERANVARATVFSRFGSKLGVLEELAVRCSGGPTMRAIRAAVAEPDPVVALLSLVDAGCEHWEVQGHILLTLKAIAELEPGAIELIDAQREDQRSSFERIARALHREGRLRGGDVRQATAGLHLVTSVESFMELRRNAGLSLAATKRVLTRTALGLFEPDA